MYGINVHKAVIKSDDVESGATVHMIDGEYDSGYVIAQEKVKRYENDTPETLAKRVLSAEHKLYSRVLRGIQEEKINLDSFQNS